MHNNIKPQIIYIVWVLTLLFSLWLVEVVLYAIFLGVIQQLVDDSSHNTDWMYNIGELILGSLRVNWVRLYIYYPAYVLMMLLLLNPFSNPLNGAVQLQNMLMTRLRRQFKENRIRGLALLNGGSLVLQFFVFELIFMPWILDCFIVIIPICVVFTFLSPFLLCKIPFYKQMVYNLWDGAYTHDL